MPLLKPESKVDKNEIKRGQQKLKSIIGGKILHDAEFLRLLKANNISNPSNTWGRINNQIRNELENGYITFEDVEDRVNQLILEESPNNRLITLEEVDAVKIEGKKRDILAKGKLHVQIPYQSSGVGDVAMGAAALGRTGVFLGSLSEGETKWKGTDLLFMDEGVNVRSTGAVLLYGDVKSVILADKSFSHTIVNVLTKDGNGLICKVANDNAQALKSIIEENIITTDAESNVSANDNVDISQLNENADILLKYADLYERGFITREEFDMKKNQLFYNKGNDNEVLEEENTQQNQTLYCCNCGSPVDKESNFCTECGEKIIK